jgi:hypothetical protein
MNDIAREEKPRHHGRDTLFRANKESHRDVAVAPQQQETLAPKRKTQTFDYIWRSGVAGGLAGSAVSNNRPVSQVCATSLTIHRQNPLSHLSIESRFCSRPTIPYSQSTPGPGLASQAQ